MPNAYSAWNAGYEIDITNPSSTAGVQAAITLPFLPGMRSDFRDIRFSDIYGNPLIHSRESYIAFSTARFWVKLPANRTKILMFYGNGGVASASDPANTFEFWDDFDALNLSVWNIMNGTASVSGSKLVLQHATLNCVLQGSATFGVNTIVEARVARANGNKCIVGYRNVSTLKAAAWDCQVPGATNDHMLAHTGSTGRWVDDGVRRVGGTYYVYGVAHVLDAPLYYVDYVYRGTITDRTPGSTALPIQFYSENGTGYLYVDWVRVRKYVATTPTLSLGKKFVQTNNGFLQQHDYISDSIVTRSSTNSSIKDTFTDAKSTKVSTGFSIGAPDLITDEITTISSITKETVKERTELRDYSLVSCDISKSITDAYSQLSANFADSKVPDEDSTVKYYARPDGSFLEFSTADGAIFTTADDIVFGVGGQRHLLFWGKVIANSPTLGSYYSTLQMQAADASRNLAVQKVPWNYQVVSLQGTYNTWSLWIAALVDYNKTGVLVKRIIDTGMPDKQFVFKPETTRLEAIKEICAYCGLIINIELMWYGSIVVPGFYAVPASEIDQVSGGFDLPAPIEFTDPKVDNIVTEPKIEGIPDEKYNMVTVYGVITSTGETTVASVYTPSVEEGIKAREYRIQDNSIEEKGSTAEIEAVKWLLYFNAPRATVSMQLINCFDFELYQRVRFGSGFSLKLRELTNSVQLLYVVAFDPRDEINTKHTVDVSGVPRPRWLRISEIKHHSEKNKETVELKLITDYIYSSADPVIQAPYSQYISPGYFKPVSDDSASTIQEVVTNTVERQLTPEICTVLSKDEENMTMLVQTQSGKLVTVRYG